RCKGHVMTTNAPTPLTYSMPPMRTTSRAMLWTGRVISAVPVLMMAGVGTFMFIAKPDVVAEGMTKYGYPAGVARPLLAVEIGFASSPVPDSSGEHPERNAKSFSLGQFRIASLLFGGGGGLAVVAEVPAVAEGVADAAGALAVELVARRGFQGGAGGEGAVDGLVGVVDVKVNGDAGGCAGFGSGDAALGEFFGEHQRRAAEVELRMADAAGRVGQTQGVFGAEGLGVEIDGGGGVLDVRVSDEPGDGRGGSFLPVSPVIR